jgi:D-alanyl-D-alanine dipeptidase
LSAARSIALLGAWLALCPGLPAAAAAPLIDVHQKYPAIRVALSYATSRNAFHQRLYSGNVALLRTPVADRLARVQKRLERQGYGLKIWDAYRPKSVQWRMWRLRPDARSRYLANPRKISKHSRGAAVDVTLVTRSGREVPMPTPHDEFSARAHRGARRGVSLRAQKNGRLLDAAMRAEGFVANSYEWWHFTAPEWSRYPASDVPVPRDKPQ